MVVATFLLVKASQPVPLVVASKSSMSQSRVLPAIPESIVTLRIKKSVTEAEAKHWH